MYIYIGVYVYSGRITFPNPLSHPADLPFPFLLRVTLPSSLVKCLWEVFVWGVVLVVRVCVCGSRGCCSLSVCV